MSFSPSWQLQRSCVIYSRPMKIHYTLNLYQEIVNRLKALILTCPISIHVGKITIRSIKKKSFALGHPNNPAKIFSNFTNFRHICSHYSIPFGWASLFTEKYFWSGIYHCLKYVFNKIFKEKYNYLLIVQPLKFKWVWPETQDLF